MIISIWKMITKDYPISENNTLSFGNSKLIFFFDNEPPQCKKSTSQKMTMRSINNNVCNSTRNKMNSKFDKQNNKQSKQINKCCKKPVTSQCARQNLKKKPNKFNSSKTIQIKGKMSSKQKTDRKQNLPTISTKGDQQIQQNIQQQKNKTIINQIYTALQHQQIKLLFGKHHNFYSPNKDYLTIKQDQSKQFKQQSIFQQFCTQQQFKQNGQSNKERIIKKPIIYSHKIQSNGNRFSYGFQNQRAPITDYLNSPLILLYDKITKQNFKTRKYIDQQFCHQDFILINKESPNWIYISPSPDILLFPLKLKQKLQLTPAQLQVPFVKFMAILFQINPNIFIRLLQPSINNVFSVWLFIQGIFKPILIDGYFPLNCALGNYDKYLWMAIFVKGICKIYGTYESQILKKIPLSGIYQLLLGQELSVVPRHFFLINKQAACKFFKKKKKKAQVIVYQDQDKLQIVQSQHQEKSSSKQINGNFYVIKPLRNLFTYEMTIFQYSLTKFQLKIVKNCQLKFKIPKSLKDLSQNIYIYEAQFKIGNQKVNLKLRFQINRKQSKSVKLKPGFYKVFVQHGKNKMKCSFLKNPDEKSNQKQKNVIKVSVMSSQQIEISDGQFLSYQNGLLQDQHNFYQCG